MGTRMQQRRGTAFEWNRDNPILADGEIGWVKDTLDVKVGDGVTAWNNLPSALMGPVEEANANLAAHESAGDPHSQYLTVDEGNLAYLGRGAKATDADKLDGIDSAAFARRDVHNTFQAGADFKGTTSAPQVRANKHDANLDWGGAHAIIEDAVGWESTQVETVRLAFHLGGVRADQIGSSRWEGLRTFTQGGTDYASFAVGDLKAYRAIESERMRAEQHEATVQESTSSTGWTTLPTVQDVMRYAPASGRCMVHLSTQLFSSGYNVYMGFQVYREGVGMVQDGADHRALVRSGSYSDAASRSILVTDLVPGAYYRFRAVHRVLGGTGTFLNRSIIVQPVM